MIVNTYSGAEVALSQESTRRYHQLEKSRRGEWDVRARGDAVEVEVVVYSDA
jgi:hypothetical protein